MGTGFIHLSDIHFGQERGGEVIIHNDVKEQLILDVAVAVKSLSKGRAAGIIVTGDIAYSGMRTEYESAGLWLDRIAEAAGCDRTDIQLVPGNHDIDRGEIGKYLGSMIDDVVARGEPALDEILENDRDREVFFQRFSSYLPFAAAYRCPLDTTGALTEDRVLEVAPGRWIRFVRLNSALICSYKDKKGTLILGARQRVLTQRRGEELVVLSHHPIDWFQDSADALRYLRSRARVFISGHEHHHSVNVVTVEPGRDLMMLASGAAIPHNANESYNYCYNTVEFDWDKASDSLTVDVRPRTWADDMKRFEDGISKKADHRSKFYLASPNFNGAKRECNTRVQDSDVESVSNTVVISQAEPLTTHSQGDVMVDNYPLLILRFFRDLSPAQRLLILASLNAIPENYTGRLGESIERRAFEGLIKQGKSQELWGKLNQILDSQLTDGENSDNS